MISIYVFGVILNGCQIALLLYQKRTKVPFEISLLSLAIADFLTSLIPSIIHIFKLLQPALYLLIIVYIYYASSMTSAFQLGFIAFQRLVAVLYPHRYHSLITRRCCITATCIMWLISFLLILPIFIKANHLYMTFYFHIPLLAGAAIFVSYFMLNYQLLKHRNRSVANQLWNKHRRILIYSTTITVVFLLSTLPYAIAHVYFKQDATFRNATSYMYIFHVIFNPLLYFLVQYLNFKKLCIKVSDTGTAIQTRGNR